MTCWFKLDDVYLDGIFCYSVIISFYFSFSCVADEIEDSNGIIPPFYHIIKIVRYLFGIGDDLVGGVVDGVALDLANGVGTGDKDLQERGVGGGEAGLVSRSCRGLILNYVSIFHLGQSALMY